MIELTELTKRFGDTLAVDRLSFVVRPGVVTGFLGPNGAGKSTTMRMMLGLDHPTSGDVRIEGKRYAELRDPLTSVGALLDARTWHGGRTAYHHLLWLAQSNGLPRQRVPEVLETVGLTSVARNRAKSFSLGMSQRLGIAAALLGEPRILLFDEPVNGLDPEGIHWVRRLMQNLAAQGRTVFVSSHLMSEMALTAEHLVVIGQGRLLADTSMATFVAENSGSYVVVRSPEHERLREVLRDAGIAATVTSDGAFRVDGGDPAKLGELAAEHRIVLHELSGRQASLEEAFMRLTAGAVDYHALDGGTRGLEAYPAARPPRETERPLPAAEDAGAAQPARPEPQSERRPETEPASASASGDEPAAPAWGEQWRRRKRGKGTRGG